MTMIRGIVILMTSVLLCNAVSLAQENNGIERVGSIYNWHRAAISFVENDYLYAAGADGIWIADVGEIDGHVDELGFIPTEGRINKFMVKDDLLLYVIGLYDSDQREGIRGLYIYDISDPTSPSQLSYFELFGYYYAWSDFDVNNDLVFLTDGSRGLKILDISDPENPIQLDFYNRYPVFNHVLVQDDRAFVGTDMGLQIFDVSDPEDIRSDTTVAMGAYLCEIYNDRLYVYAPYNGFYSMDISSEWYEGFDVHFGGRRRFRGCQLVDDRLYTVAGDSVIVFDISDNEDPKKNPGFKLDYNLSHIYVEEEIAYVSSDYGISVYDISHMDDIQKTGSAGPRGIVYGLKIENSILYSANHYGGLDIFSIQSPLSPRLLSTIELEGIQTDLDVHDDIAFIASESGGLRIVNVEHPAETEIIAVFDSAKSFVNVLVKNNVAFACDVSVVDGGLKLINVNDPTSPELISAFNFEPEYKVYTVSIEDSIALLLDGSPQLVIADISNPNEVEVISSWNSSPNDQLRETFLKDSYAYLLSKNMGVRILDISDPFNPAEIGTCSFRHGTSIVVEGGYAYVGSVYGLSIVNVTEPSTPHLVGWYDTPSRVFDIDTYEGLVYTSEYTNIGIYDPAEAHYVDEIFRPYPESHSLIKAYPNPFNSKLTIEFDGSMKQVNQLALYDYLGRLVQEFVPSSGTSSIADRIYFDATGLAAGNYFILFSSDGKIQTIPVIHLK